MKKCLSLSILVQELKSGEAVWEHTLSPLPELPQGRLPGGVNY